MPTQDWGTDVPVSKPSVVESDNLRITDLGAGFVFTVKGMRHNLTETERDEIFTPTFAPKIDQ